MNQPLSDNTARARRIIVIVPDEPGSLARVTQVLAEAEINIEEIDGRLVGDLGVLTLRTSDDNDLARSLLDSDSLL